MKKLIVVVALLFVPLLASAQQSDAVLTPDGTLYSVQFERAEEHPDVVTTSSAYLKLTARKGEVVTHEVIPASTEDRGGNHNAMLAYDSESGMLFVFWLRNVGILSQLMFTSRDAEGVWAPAATFGDWGDQRKNLRVAVTRKFRDDDGDLRSGISVHLAWWELNTTTGRESAKYVMASIRHGQIVDFEPLQLSELVPDDLLPAEEVDKNFLNQPMLFTTPTQDSVVLVFGDVRTGTVNEVRITPRKIIGNGRLRVPGGKREGSFRAPAMEVANSRIEGVYGDSNRLAFYIVAEDHVRYVMLQEGNWSDSHVIKVGDDVSPAAAVDAVRRLVSGH